MHVGLNLVFLVPGATGGMEVYARELIRGLREQRPELRLTAFVGVDAVGWSELPAVTVPVRASRRADWVRGEQQHLPRLARRAGVDVLHSLASTGPWWGGFKRVLTVHDLVYAVRPEAHFGLLARGMRVIVPLSARRSDRVIAVSESTRRDLVRHVKLDPALIDVVPNGVTLPRDREPDAGDEIRRRYGLGERRVVLTASAMRPHKNLAGLLRALAALDPRPVLILPGYPTPHEQELRALAAELGVDDDVRFIGWVDEHELDELYAIADCFAYPSFYEGFGLPVLEAMARGVPVACSDTSSLPEVAGDAALLFDPERPEEIATAIGAILADRARAGRLAEAGRAQAARFSWAEAARRTAAVYDSVAGRE